MLGGTLAFLRFNISHGLKYSWEMLALSYWICIAVFTTMVLSTGFSITFISNKPVFILALFAFPFLDTIRVIILRVISEKSVFS